MPQKLKAPRLWLRPVQFIDGKKQRDAAWIILDRGKQISTGCLENERTKAENELLRYLENRKEKPKKYVYFITTEKEGFPIKIGISETHKMRFATLQIALPYKIKVLAILPTDDPLFERRIHRKFESTRLSGEWFERTPELIKYIEQLTIFDNAA